MFIIYCTKKCSLTIYIKNIRIRFAWHYGDHLFTRLWWRKLPLDAVVVLYEQLFLFSLFLKIQITDSLHSFKTTTNFHFGKYLICRGI